MRKEKVYLKFPGSGSGGSGLTGYLANEFFTELHYKSKAIGSLTPMNVRIGSKAAVADRQCESPLYP
jgi:hypothetical protein